MTANTNTTLKQLNPDIACLEKICTQLQAELTHSEKTLRTSGYLKKLAAGLSTKESSCTLLPPDQVLLSTGKSNGVWQYYVSFSPKTGKRHYLPSSERQLAVSLAQRDYLHLSIGETERLLKRAELVWKQGGMLTWNSNLANTLAENINAKLPPARKALITPRILTDTEYTTLWMATSRAELTYRQEEKIHITDRGEKVRSKSEKMIADKLYQLGVPYRYEIVCAFEKTGHNVYPDFTVFRQKDRSEVYLEHFGMMDNSDYARKNIEKIEEYANNGIVSGKNAIFLFETSVSGLNMDQLVQQLKTLGCI